MRGTWTVFQKEVAQYFASPIAYLIAFAFLLLTALWFNRDLTVSAGQRIPADAAIIPNQLALLLIFIAPLLTMRLLAEESREGTLELLMTAPVSDVAIVIGKFMGAWFYYSVLLGITVVYQILLSGVTNPDPGVAIAAHLGIWLYGGAALGIGLMFSAMTENQIVAAFLGVSALLLLYQANAAGQIVASFELANFLRTLSFPGHFESSFAFGLVRGEDIVYYAGIMVLALFIAVQVVQSRRWR
jgi:ABC-2 type transport system permease protein